MSTSEADKAIEAAYKASMTNLRHGGELDISDKSVQNALLESLRMKISFFRLLWRVKS